MMEPSAATNRVIAGGVVLTRIVNDREAFSVGLIEPEREHSTGNNNRRYKRKYRADAEPDQAHELTKSCVSLEGCDAAVGQWVIQELGDHPQKGWCRHRRQQGGLFDVLWTAESKQLRFQYRNRSCQK